MIALLLLAIFVKNGKNYKYNFAIRNQTFYVPLFFYVLNSTVLHNYIGAIQIIRDTFLPLF
jgi:hypothetical protein